MADEHKRCQATDGTALTRASQTISNEPNSGDLNQVAAASSRLFVGTSGWAYPTWKPAFYPATLAAKKFLPFYATQLNSVEVNYTFRALPSVKTLEGWLAAVPDGFRFSFKAPQRITHFKRLRECEQDLAQLVGCLEPVRQAEKLGLMLVQLPPNFKSEAELLKRFLDSPALQSKTVPIAFEFRHESWFVPEIEAVLRDYDAAVCIAESDDLATPEMHTAATHTSFRLRRSGGYSETEVAAFAKRFVALSAERDVYVYLKHEDEPSGALNAIALLKNSNAEAEAQP